MKNKKIAAERDPKGKILCLCLAMMRYVLLLPANYHRICSNVPFASLDPFTGIISYGKPSHRGGFNALTIYDTYRWTGIFVTLFPNCRVVDG